MNLLIISLILILVGVLILIIKDIITMQCKASIPNALKDLVKQAVLVKLRQSDPAISIEKVSAIVDKYSASLKNCLSITSFPTLAQLADATDIEDDNVVSCIRSALNLIVMKYWAESLESNTEQNLTETMDCIDQLPLDENTITRFPIRAAECAGERNPLLPDFFDFFKSRVVPAL